MTERRDRPITIPELARRWGKPERTVRRWLVAINERAPERVLFKMGRIWVTSWGRLRRVVPEMTDSGPEESSITEADIEELNVRMRTLERKLDALATAHMLLAKRLGEEPKG